MSELKYVNFIKQLYYLQSNTIVTRRNVTNAFRIHCIYVIVHAREYFIKEDFNQNGSLIII